ncbi:carbohydrate-binding module family 13 protein [Pisolithus marmoratus]|nr:carbohydrate-binding module family 13 protein [Pisolithus marmoratus]
MPHLDSSHQLTRMTPREEGIAFANCERTVTACIRSGGTYALTNVKAQNSCLDLSGADHYSIIGFEYHGGSNQTWIFERQYNGNYLIKSVRPNLYLSIEGEPRDGTKVVAKSTPFEWHVEDQPGFQQAIRLFVPETNQNVDLSDNGNPTSSAPVTLWRKWNGEHQIWRIASVG